MHTEIKTYSILHRVCDLDALCSCIKSKAFDRQSHVNICLTHAVYEKSQQKGFRSDITTASSYSQFANSIWKTNAIEAVSSIATQFKKQTFARAFLVAYQPRLVEIFSYIHASLWLLKAVNSRYPDANYMSCRSFLVPYIPVSRAPFNNPDSSSILNLLALSQNTNDEFKVSFLLFTNLIKQYILFSIRSGIILIQAQLKSFAHLHKHQARRNGNWQSINSKHVNHNLPKRSALLLLGDFERTLPICDLLLERKNCNDIVLNWGGGEAVNKKVESCGISLWRTNSTYLSELAYAWCRFRFLRLAISLLFIILSRRMTNKGKSLRLDSKTVPTLLYSLLQLQVWDHARYIEAYVSLSTLLTANNIDSLLTSCVDTPEARLALIMASDAGITTLSYPHAFHLIDHPISFYLAQKVLVHGQLESKLAIDAGISLNRIEVIGSTMKSSVEAHPKRHSFKTAILLSNNPTWAYMPMNLMAYWLSSLFQYHYDHGIETSLKLHPTNDDLEDWTELARKWNIEVDQSRWHDDDYALIDFAFFLGHPGSSIVILAMQQSVPAIVLPWTQSDRCIFGAYGLTKKTPMEAFKCMLKSRHSSSYHSQLMHLMSKFRNNCISQEEIPARAISKAISSAHAN